MKKKLLVLTMAVAMMFGMTACGKDNSNSGSGSQPQKEEKEKPDRKTTEEKTEAPTEAPTEAVTEAPTEAPTEVPTEAPSNQGSETLAGLISYSLDGTEYTANQTSTNTNVYVENQSLQSLAISALDYTGMSKDEILSMYKAQIEAVYGTNYTESTTTFNGITYTTYEFGTNNAMSSDIYVTTYLYASDNNVCIYAEEAWATMLGSSSGDTEKVMNTVKIIK